MSAETDKVEDILRQYGAACNAGDFDTWMSLWSADGRQMPPDAPARVGIETIREAMEPVFSNMNLEFDLVSIDESRVHGDLALTRCTYSLSATPKEGGESIEVMPDGKALTLYERQPDGAWRIAYDSFNANTP